MSESFVARVARAKEFSAIGALLVAVYIDDDFSPPQIEADLRDVESRSRSGIVLIAVDSADRVLGTVCFLTSESPVAQIARSGEAEFRLLAVVPEARGDGVGAALVRACIERAHHAGATALVLSTQPSQQAAHHLYERLGFHRDADRDWRTASGGQRLVYVLAMQRWAAPAAPELHSA